MNLAAFSAIRAGGKGRDIETDTLGILVSGDRTARSWADPRPEQASFEDLLAVMEALAPGHRFTLTPAKPREQAALGADVQLDGKACGYFAACPWRAAGSWVWTSPFTWRNWTCARCRKSSPRP